MNESEGRGDGVGLGGYQTEKTPRTSNWRRGMSKMENGRKEIGGLEAQVVLGGEGGKRCEISFLVCVCVRKRSNRSHHLQPAPFPPVFLTCYENSKKKSRISKLDS